MPKPLSESAALIGQVKDAVCTVYGIERAALESRSRRRKVAWPRQVAMMLARELSGRSLHYVAHHFGRDHTTIIHAERALKDRLLTDAGGAELVDQVRALLAARAPTWISTTRAEHAAAISVCSFCLLLGEIARRRRKGLPLPKYLFVDASAVLTIRGARRRQAANFPA